MMFFLGSYFSDKYSIVAVIAILGAMIMGSSFLFSTNKKVIHSISNDEKPTL